MKKLTQEFYAQTDVVSVARQLVGKILVTHFDGILTTGRIVETEAYVAFTDRASHAFAGKRTARNEHMYAGAGTAYVYICYGLHQMLNVVTNAKDIPDAVLIRAIEPVEGIEKMLERTGKKQLDFTLTRGPGNVGKALGIFKKHSGLHLSEATMYIMDDEQFQLVPHQIKASARIGIDSAGVDAALPYRFFLKGNKYVSGKIK